MASDSESGSEYEVQKLLQQRKRRGIIEYLVRWRGFGPENDSWESSKNLDHCKAMIEEFKNEEKASPKKSRGRSRSRSKSRTTPKRSTSRGRRSTSRGRRSPGRKSTSATKSTTVVRRSTRLVAGGEVQKTTEVTTTTKQESIPGNSAVSNTVVTETKETVQTTTAASTSSDKSGSLFLDYLHPTSSDYPLLVIFACVALITLSVILEKYVNFGDCWASVQQSAATLYNSVTKLIKGKK